MAPALAQGIPSRQHIRQVSRSLSSTFSSLHNRAADAAEPSLASMFALVINKGSNLSARATSAFTGTFQSSLDARAATTPLSISKRQNLILAIPTTYKGLNSGPAPGAVVGIILGTIAGFIICLYLLLFAFQFQLGGTDIVTEEVITTSHRRSRRSSRHTVMSERQPAPTSRRETIVIEETHRRAASPDEVIVEEHEDDIVEVIEDPSSISSRTPPPAQPSRRESRRSGFRTVDPAELGGGRDRFKGIGRR